MKGRSNGGDGVPLKEVPLEQSGQEKSQEGATWDMNLLWKWETTYDQTRVQAAHWATMPEVERADLKQHIGLELPLMAFYYICI